MQANVTTVRILGPPSRGWSTRHSCTFPSWLPSGPSWSSALSPLWYTHKLYIYYPIPLSSIRIFRHHRNFLFTLCLHFRLSDEATLVQVNCLRVISLKLLRQLLPLGCHLAFIGSSDFPDQVQLYPFSQSLHSTCRRICRNTGSLLSGCPDCACLLLYLHHDRCSVHLRRLQDQPFDLPNQLHVLALLWRLK